MPHKEPALSPLNAKKKLLVLESDLNRAQLVESVREWKVEFHRAKEQVAHIGSVASVAARAFATVSTARRLFTRPANGGKKSWLSYLVDGMTTGTSLWYLLKSARRKNEP